MAINGVSGRTSLQVSSILNLKSQLEDLTLQFSTGKKATTYAGLGSGAGVSTGLRAQIERIASFANTQNFVTGRINLANLSLQGISKAGTEVKTAAQSATIVFDSAGKTPGQKIAQGSFTQTISLLNSDFGGHQLFSGKAPDTQSTAPPDEIMDGVGVRAGFRQVIDERRQADQGASPNLGRLVASAVSAAPAATFTLKEDVAASPFGLKLSNVTSTLTGATVSAPTGTPPTISVDLGAVNPNAGEKVKFTFNLPDGSTDEFTLTASTQSPTPAGAFAIGADTNATAVNLRNAIRGSIDTVANTSLVAASAVKASDEFFSSNPPQRVVSTVAPPAAPVFTNATTKAAGTPANTVFWYTGENGTDPARSTAEVQVDQSVTVQYGIRANESAIVDQLKNMAVYAAVTTSPTDPNATAQITALNSRIVQNLSVHPGTQGIQDIQTDLANAQADIKTVKDRQKQTGDLAESMLGSIENVSREEVAAKILAVQTSLQGSYQLTTSLHQLSLVNFL